MSHISKDWTGNKSFFITNTRKKDSEVSERDLYGTHPDSVRAFLDAYQLDKSYKIWEPACGTMNIVKVLKERNYDVILASDVYDYNVGFDLQLDFLNCKYPPYDSINCILTNPPYKYADKFVEKSMQLLPDNGLCIMFLKLTFLEGKKRYQMFKDYPLKEIYIHSSRQGCSPKGYFDFPNGGAAAYAWYVWCKGYKGATTIKWISPN